jgi:hypothetical protein
MKSRGQPENTRSQGAHAFQQLHEFFFPSDHLHLGLGPDRTLNQTLRAAVIQGYRHSEGKEFKAPQLLSVVRKDNATWLISACGFILSWDWSWWA